MTNANEFSSLSNNPRFADSSHPYLLLDRNLRIHAANRAYLRATERTYDQLRGQYIFDVFPDNPNDPCADGVAKLGESLEEVLRTGRRSLMWVQRYDIPGDTADEPFVLKYWSPSNSPIRDRSHRGPVGIVHHVEDVTTLWPTIRGDGNLATEITTVPTPTAWASFILAARNNERLYQQLCREAEQLTEALTSRIVIEQAKGVLMAQRGCGQQEAFDSLRSFARGNNLDIHVVAQSLIEQVHQPRQ